jgi:YggT family protein
MYMLTYLIGTLIEIYIWIIIAGVLLNLLVNFNVVNPYSPAIRAIQTFCHTLTEPLLRPIRDVMPNLGGIDISPLVLILGLEILWRVVLRTLI